MIATLSNLHPDPTWSDVGPRFIRAIRFAPHLSDAVDALRNVMLFAGLGGVWIATSRLKRPSVALTTLTIVSLLLSGLAETLQLFSPVRESSMLDVITDTLGGLMGGLVTLGAFAVIQERAGKRSYLGIPAMILAVGYGLATIMEAFIPLFRQNLLPQLGGSLADRLGRAVAAIRPESISQIPWIDGLIFFPAGVFAVAALVENNVSNGAAAFLVVCISALVYPIVEVAHGVAAEPIVLGAALVHVVAASIGAVVAAVWLRPLRRHEVRWHAQVAAVGYALIIMVWSWRPFRLDLSVAAMSQQFTAVHLIPLRALAARQDLFSVTDVLAQGMIFVPLGALLAVWPVRRSGALRGMWPAVYLAAVLEIGKIPILGRFMDVTHILIQAAGATIGFLLVRRMGYRINGELVGRA
jgi:VanZ family protein